MILALDAATEKISALVSDAQGCLKTSVTVDFMLEKPVALIRIIDKALTKARRDLDDIRCIAVDRGPGSFTGLRIAVATTMALAHAKKIPVVGLQSIPIIARNHTGACPIAVVMDARKENVYCAAYRGKKTLLRPCLMHHKVFLKTLGRLVRAEKITLTGDGIKKYHKALRETLGARATFLRESCWYPRPAHIAACAGEAYRKKSFVRDVRRLTPDYFYSRYCTMYGK